MKLLDLFEQSLEEVSMSPSSLQTFANSPQAQGILVGFEAELAVPMQGGLDAESTIELDYDRDERCWDIDQIVHFFQQGDNPLTRVDANRLYRDLVDDYQDWLEEIIYGQYTQDLDDKIRDLARDNNLNDQEIDQLLDNPSSKEYLAYAEHVEEMVRDAVFSSNSQADWLKDQDYRTMIDIEQTYDLSWPYMQVNKSDPDGIYQVARDIKNDLGIAINVSTEYHVATREPSKWVLEPDSSIQTPDDSTYGGLELITPTPPFPIGESLEWIDAVFDWAKRYGCQTNHSTGFHIGVSLPEQTTANIDWIKLVLFLGDKYILQQYGRQSNIYTVSALTRIRQHMKNNENFPVQQAMDAMRKGLMNLASQTVGRPSADKYTSVNVKTRYVEFRSAGGNYLEDQEQIKNTMLRYVRAIVIAADPNAEKQEYATKLYKLLSPTRETHQSSVINLFSMYSSGLIDKELLKKQLKSLDQQKKG